MQPIVKIWQFSKWYFQIVRITRKGMAGEHLDFKMNRYVICEDAVSEIWHERTVEQEDFETRPLSCLCTST